MTPDKALQNIINKIFSNAVMTEYAPIGAGFYGKVYAVKIDKPPYKIAVKLFNAPNDNTRELIWYTALQKSGIPLPAIFGAYSQGNVHALAMQLLSGRSATNTRGLDKYSLDKLGEQIAHTAAQLHSFTGSGYGNILSNKDVCGGQHSSWIEYYKIKSLDIYNAITNGARQGLLSNAQVNVFEKAVSLFSKIFCSEPNRPSLIHGDLNTDNIIINPDNAELSAVIDPINSLWGDSEYELFQFDCAAGKEYSLLQKYSAYRPLSNNYNIKSAFYAAFAEANHYCNISKAADDNLQQFINKLENSLTEL